MLWGEFQPNSTASMISVSVDQISMQNLFSVYENAGYLDFKTTEKLEQTDFIKRIDTYYFRNFSVDLQDDDFNISVEGVLEARGRTMFAEMIPFHPYVQTGGIQVSANAFLENFQVSSDGKIHLNVCLSDVNSDISDVSYGYGAIVDDFIVDGIIGGKEIAVSQASQAIDATVSNLTDAANCVDLTDQIGISYPKFLDPVAIGHSRAKVKDGKLIVSGCPTTKTLIDSVLVISDSPCETVAYQFFVYTADDVGNADSKSNMTATLCGNDTDGKRHCLKTPLNKQTQKGDISHRLVESGMLLLDNLSLTLESDNSGKKPGWYVDSATVEIVLPNGSQFHRWFPVHNWIGGDSALSYTVEQGQNLNVYTFTVTTGSKSRFDHSGTDSKIVADVCDVNDKCLMFHLDKQDHDDFEAGSTSTYSIVTDQNLVEVKSLTLHNAYDGDHAGWYVQDVVYKHYAFPESKDHSAKNAQGFLFRQWLAKGESKGAYYTGTRENNLFDRSDWTFLSPINSQPIFYYRDIFATRYVADNFGYDVSIKTKSGGASGTDAKILLTLEGCSGSKEIFNLNDDKDNFEKGQTDVFRLTGIQNLGGIRKISLFNDGSGDGAGWAPESMSILPVIYDGDVYSLSDAAVYSAFDRNLNKSDGWSWEYETGFCEDPQMPMVNAAAYVAQPGEYVTIRGKNLNLGLNISLNLDQKIQPVQIASRFIKFKLPEDIPLGEYDEALSVDGSVQSGVSLSVRGQEPFLLGIAVNSAEPGDAFEAYLTGIDESAQFYLGNYLLKTLRQTGNQVYLQIPLSIENGIYSFRTLSLGWDVAHEAKVEITGSIVPHVSAISDSIVYAGETLIVQGRNFGSQDVGMTVKIAGNEILSDTLADNLLTVKIPFGISGENARLSVCRKGVCSPEEWFVTVNTSPKFMLFDDLERKWTSENAELFSDSAVRSGNFGYSLRIHGGGYMTIVSPQFGNEEIGFATGNLLLDIWIPEDQVNPYWLGDVQLSVNIPSAGLYNAWNSRIPLTGLSAGWNTVSFALCDEILNALNEKFNDAQISLHLNVNQNSEDFRIDNLRFGDGERSDRNPTLVLVRFP